MNEAKASINIRTNYRGYPAVITVRSDTSLAEVRKELDTELELLAKLGYITGAAQAQEQAPQTTEPQRDQSEAQVPTCQHCESAADMELIAWTNKETGEYREAWKCMGCDKWHYASNQKRRK